jgi:hypothetical protein
MIDVNTIPKDAVPVGKSAQGDYKFIGRAKYQDDVVVGEIQNNLSVHLTFVHKSEKHQTNQYKVLCHPSELERQAITRIPGSEALIQGK